VPLRGWCVNRAARAAVGSRGKWQQAVLFLKKKNQKNFSPFAGFNA
jgi:hypothetical protein